ncbi:imidazole glycerol phosphate synthase subunit HisH [Limosilactobacillus fermentum]
MGAKTVLTNDAKQVVSSDGIILTGIGTYQSGMTNFMQRHLIGPIRRAVEQGVPLLGIGLDMELLFDYSTEGGLILGLGLIKGRVTEIPSTPQLPVPIVGWNMNRLENPVSRFNQIDEEYTYFVHSYYVQTAPQNIVATAEYGVVIPTIVHRGNVVGMQFQAEKSGPMGLNLLNDFLEGVVAR